MKQKIKIFALIMMIFFCSSCGKDTLTVQGEELVCCLNERNANGIKELFCEKVRTSSQIDIDEQIETVFELLGDTTIDSYNLRGGVESKSVRDHKMVLHEQCGIIKPTQLSDEEEIAQIYFFTYTINEEHSDRVGISVIAVDYESERYKIGDNSLVHDF